MASNNYHQRVVFAGLSRMTEDRNLIVAGYQQWENNLSNNEFDIFEIVANLTKFLGLGSAERKKLMVAMHAASARLEDELQPVPEYIKTTNGSNASAAQAQPTAAASVKTGSAHKVVTERYLQLVSQHLKRLDSASFNEIAVILSNEGLSKLPTQIDRSVKGWGAGGLAAIDFTTDVSVEQCQACALEFYVLLTEIIGPVDSDVIVNKAIADVSNLPESQQFAPNNLL